MSNILNCKIANTLYPFKDGLFDRSEPINKKDQLTDANLKFK